MAPRGESVENTATVEQAEPQGSAAPDAAASAPERSPSASSPSPADRSSRDLLRSGIEARSAKRPGASSATQETSAADEQPASESSPARGGEASETGADQPTDPQQLRLSRSERKALKTATNAAPATPARPSADTSGTAPSAQPPSDPIERVERSLADAVARIEARLPAQADPAVPSQANDNDDYYGDDARFIRLATIATRPGTTGEYLSNEDASWLEEKSLRRETRDRTRLETEQTYRVNQSQIAFAAADAHGIDRQSLLSAPSMQAIYDRFVDQGRALEREAHSAKTAESAKEIERLKGVNQQLADEVEAYERRLPGFARPLVGGGTSGTARAAQIADRRGMSGTQLIRSGLAKGPTKSRPGARRGAA